MCANILGETFCEVVALKRAGLEKKDLFSLAVFVNVYRKTRHSAAHFEIFFCTYGVVGVQILSTPSFIVVA